MSLPELVPAITAAAATQSPWVAAPIVIPLGAALLLFIPSGRGVKVALSVAATLAMLLASLHLVALTQGVGGAGGQLGGQLLSSAMGAWPAPFGIVLVADKLGAWMSALTGVSGLLAVLYAAAFPDRVREKYGMFAFLQFLFAGVQISFLTGDLFNLFVAFEVMLVASYALTVLGSTREQLREGFRYIVMNLSASALLVVTCGMVYALLGTLNMAHIAQRSMELGANHTVTAFGVLLLLVFAAKSALFPLGFWLPGTYPAVPPAIGAFFAAVLTKVGVYALTRTTSTLFVEEPQVAQAILLTLGTVTMLYGGLGILSQREWRRSLAFVVVSSVGYLAYGLGIGTPAATSAALFYMGVSIVVTTALFLLAGIAERMAGTTLIAVRGVLEFRPALAAAFLFLALTVAGLPPTGGFIAKFALVQAALAAPASPLIYLATASALVSSLVILYAMLNIWRGFFWGRRRSEKPIGEIPRLRQAPMYLSAGVVVAAALFAGPLNAMTQRAAWELASPLHYITGVLGPEALHGEAVEIPPAPTKALDHGKHGEDAGNAEHHGSEHDTTEHHGGEHNSAGSTPHEYPDTEYGSAEHDPRLGPPPVEVTP